MNLKKMQLNGIELIEQNTNESGEQVRFVDFKDVNSDNTTSNIPSSSIVEADSGLDHIRITKSSSESSTASDSSGTPFAVTASAPAIEYPHALAAGAGTSFSSAGNFPCMSEAVDNKPNEAFALSGKIYSDSSLDITSAGWTGYSGSKPSAGDLLFGERLYDAGSGYLISFHTWTQSGGIYLEGGGTSSITYDQYTPTESGEHTVIGCTATATSQIIYYWGHEQSLTGHSITVNSISFDNTDQYTTRTLGIDIDGEALTRDFLNFTQLSSKLSDIKYQFDPDEIAALGFGVGVKIESDYGVAATGGTGAYISYAMSLMQEVGFSSVKLAEEYDADGLLVSSQINLEQELINNIQLGRPVLTGMHSAAGGHAVVIDGYNSGDSTFHFNMGWGGSYDGWYSLSDLPADFENINAIVYDAYLDTAPPQIVTISVQDAAAGEPGDNGTFRISRSGDTTSALTVYFSTGGTATSGSDYTLKNGSTVLSNSVVIAAGQSYVDVTLAIIDDVIVENAESAVVNLTGDVAYTLGATTSETINITDNDVLLPTVAISATHDAGEPSSDGMFRISRTGDTSSALTVYFNIGGTATGSLDYTLKNGSTTLTNSVVIAAGQSYVDVTLDMIDDALVESTETAAMNLIADPAYILGAVTNGSINITDNDFTFTPLTVSSSIISGNVANYTAIYAGGSQLVSSGGLANTTEIYAGGSQTVFYGGTATNTTVNSRGVQTISGGAVFSNTISFWGSQFVYSGGTATSTTVDRSGSQTVFSGGTATFTTISSGGVLDVASGGTANIIRQQSGGIIIANTGAAITGGSNTRTDGHSAFSITGGTASNFLLENGGSLTVLSWQSAVDTLIGSGGSQNVLSSATTTRTTINSGGSQALNSATANSTTINSGGSQNVDGGKVNYTTINGGAQTLANSAVASSTVINSGGFQNAVYSAVTNSTTINSGGCQLIGYAGSAKSTIINSGGSMGIFGGYASGIDQQAGAAIMADTGAIIAGGVNALNNFSIASGIASNFLLENGGYLKVLAGNSAISTVVSAGGRQEVLAGGLATSAVLNSGGRQIVSGGGTASGTTINSDGYDLILGRAIQTAVKSGGSQVVALSGIADATTISAGGYQNAGGTATNTVVSSGGVLMVGLGGSAMNFTFYSGGIFGWDFNAVFSGVSSSGVSSGGTVWASSSLTSSYNLYLKNANQNVLNGYKATSTTIRANGLQNVSAGGLADYATISSGGLQNISSGGRTDYTSVKSGGLQNISSGGLADSTIISSAGVQNISSGGSANSASVNFGGSQNVYGTANDTFIYSNSIQNIFSGGIASSTVINNNGMQNISSGGMAYATTVSSAARQTVSSGGTASNTAIGNSGYQYILSGGNASSTIIGSGGSQIISSGGTADIIVQWSSAAIITNTGATITGGSNARLDGHSAFSITGGNASNFLLENGGQLSVLSGNSAADTVVGSNGSTTISSGGVAGSTTVSSSGRLSVAGGAAANMINQQSGAVIITNTGATITGGSNTRTGGHSAFSIITGAASNFLLENGGRLDVLSGHFAMDTLVGSNGNLYISGGGLAANTVIQNHGNEGVLGITSQAIIQNGGNQIVYSGGTAVRAIINSSGSQYIYSGGKADSTTVSSGGSQFLSSGASANMTNQQSGAVIITNTGATITNGVNARIDGHEAFSISDGRASNFLLENNGQLSVLYGHSSIDTLIASGGQQNVSNGGKAVSTLISSGGMQNVSTGGTASGTIVQRGGYENVYGITSQTVLMSGGSQLVFAGGSANSTIVNSGGYQYASGTASQTTVQSGGLLMIGNGGTASGFTISSGGIFGWDFNAVFSGTSSGTAITSSSIHSSFNLYLNNTSQDVLAGYIATSANINSGGRQRVSSGGAADSATVNTDGAQEIFSGGTANGAIINAGGRQSIFQGGMADLATVNADGAQEVCSGGAAVSAMLNSGGSQIVFSGGRADSTTVNSGGYQYASGLASQTMVQSGGMLMVGNGGNAAGFNISSGGILGWDFNAVFSGTSNGADVSSSSGKFSSNLFLMDGAIQYVSSGYTATSAHINRGAQQIVDSMGIANGTIVNDGGLQFAFSSSFVNGAIINSGGGQRVYGTVTGAILNAGGSQIVFSGGRANSTTINSGGIMSMGFGGVASSVIQQAGGAIIADTGTTISGGLNTRTDLHSAFSVSAGIASNFMLENSGQLSVLSGHSAVDTLVANGGSYMVLSGGVTSNSIVNSGGNMHVSSGGAAKGSLTVNGGHVILEHSSSLQWTAVNYTLAGAWLNDSLLTIQSGIAGSSILNFSLNVNNTSIGSYILASGTDLTSMSTAHFMVTDDGVTKDVQVGSSWTFADGDTVMLTFADGASSDKLIATFTVETSPPSLPDGLKQTVTGNNVNFDWNVSTDLPADFHSGFKDYQIRIDNNSDFSSPEYSGSPVVNTFSSTLTDGVYFWQVRAGDNVGNYSAWSNGGSFTVDITPPSIPADLSQTVTGSSVVFDWADSSDATSGVKQYEIQVDNNNDFSSPEHAASLAVNTDSIVSLADGSYYWQVRTLDNSGNYSAWSSAVNFMVDTTVPDAPAGLAATVVSNGVTLDWNDSTDATSGVKQYEFQVDNNSDFSSNEKAGTTVISNTSVTGMADGNYFWRVRAVDNFGNLGAWTAGSSFTVDVTAPDIPAALSQIVTGRDVALDWADSTDATSGVKQYEFQVDNNSDFSSNEKTGTTITSTAAVSALADGNYYWRVRVLDNSGNYSSWSAVNSFMVDSVAPSVPAALAQTVTGGSVALDWDDATDNFSGVKQYEVLVDNNSDFSSPEHTLTVAVSGASLTGLADGNYFWCVRTVDNNNNNSTWSTANHFIVDTAGPDAPSGLNGIVTGSNAALAWTDSIDTLSGVKQYEFQIDNNSDFSSSEKAGTANICSASATGIADGIYYWRVRAVDNYGNYGNWNTGNNLTVDTTAPSIPSGLTGTVTGSNVSLDWNDSTDVNGVKQYEFQIDDNSDFSSNEKSGTSATSDVTASGLAEGLYNWRIRAVDNFGNFSDWSTVSNFAVDTIAPSAPANLSMAFAGSSVVLDWDNATDNFGVKQYEFQIDDNSDFSSNEKSGTSPTSDVTVSGLADGIFYWRVRSLDNAGNSSGWSTGSNFTADFTAPIPAGLTETVTGSSVALDWDNAVDIYSGIKQYEFQIDNNSDFSSSERSGTSITSDAAASGLSDGIYFWRVRSQDNAGNYSDWNSGNTFTVDSVAPSVPAALSITSSGNSVALDWSDATDSLSGVKQYEFQIDDNSDFSSNEKSGTSITSDGAASGLADGNYYWRVRSQDNSGNYSNWAAGSSFNIDSTAPTLPGGLKQTVKVNNVALDWTDSTDLGSGLKNYLFEYALNAQFTDAVQQSVVNSNTSIASLADGNYYWRVQAVDNNGNASAWATGSFMVDTKAPNTPEGLKQTINGKSATFDWYDAFDASSGIKSYLFELDNNSNFSSPEYYKQVTGSQITLDNLASGTYYWRVRTQDNSGNWSSWSTAVNFNMELTPPTVPGGLKQTVTGNSVAFDWNDSTDASGIKQYEIRVDNNSNFCSPEYSTQVDASAASASLALGTYYWQVRAQDKSGNYSAWSSSSKFVVTPADAAANDYKTARDISNLDNWVGYGDPADFYKLTMTNAGILTLGLTGLTSNADLSLLSSTGTVLKTSAKTGTADEAINSVSLLAGTYYVKVAAGSGVNDAGYTLSNTIKYCPADKAANDYKTALDISNLDNWVGFGDASDVYKITMTNAGTLTLGLTGLTSNADLSLLNSAGTVLKTSAKTGTADEAINSVSLLAGTYYVKVAAGTGVSDASYTLSSTIKYCPADKAANDYKTAQDISTLDNWVGFGDAADFYKLTMTNAGTLTLGLTGLNGNADLSLLNSAGTVLKTSAKTGTADEAISSVLLLAGTYYVKVATGYGVNNASYTLSNTVKYCPADKAANDYKTALDISTLDNWVGFGDASDVYKITMTNAGTLTLGLTGLSGNADLSLLSSTGTALKTSVNAGTANEAINNVSLLAGTYYVKVAAGFGVNEASYTLSNTVNYFPGDTNDKAGNTLAAAKLIDIPTQAGWVGFGDTGDYYRFDLAAAAQGTLRLYDMAGGNADLSLYNAKGMLLKKSAKLGALEDTLTSTLAAGTYYARVNAVSGNIDYKLDFSKKDTFGMLAS